MKWYAPLRVHILKRRLVELRRASDPGHRYRKISKGKATKWLPFTECPANRARISKSFEAYLAILLIGLMVDLALEFPPMAHANTANQEMDCHSP